MDGFIESKIKDYHKKHDYRRIERLESQGRGFEGVSLTTIRELKKSGKKNQ